MEARTQTLETTSFGKFTIEKDIQKFTVRITKKSAKAKGGEKKICYYSFTRHPTAIARIEAMDSFIAKFKSQEDEKEKNRGDKQLALKQARTNFEMPFEIDQILYCIWGYDQTNVNFYQIIRIKNKTIFLRELKQEGTETMYMQGNTVPVKGAYAGEETKRIVQFYYDGSQAVAHLRGLSIWDGNPLSYTSYY